MTLRLRLWLIRLLGVKECGEFGGEQWGALRWCCKPFGHSDSCAFDAGVLQPGFALRARARGWDALREKS